MQGSGVRSGCTVADAGAVAVISVVGIFIPSRFISISL
jgi:hypothetical protein